MTMEVFTRSGVWLFEYSLAQKTLEKKKIEKAWPRVAAVYRGVIFRRLLSSLNARKGEVYGHRVIQMRGVKEYTRKGGAI